MRCSDECLATGRNPSCSGAGGTPRGSDPEPRPEPGARRFLPSGQAIRLIEFRTGASAAWGKLTALQTPLAVQMRLGEVNCFQYLPDYVHLRHQFINSGLYISRLLSQFLSLAYSVDWHSVKFFGFVVLAVDRCQSNGKAGRVLPTHAERQRNWFALTGSIFK